MNLKIITRKEDINNLIQEYKIRRSSIENSLSLISALVFLGFLTGLFSFIITDIEASKGFYFATSIFGIFCFFMWYKYFSYSSKILELLLLLKNNKGLK